MTKGLAGKLAAAGLLFAVAAGPVLLYDRLLAKHLLEQGRAGSVKSVEDVLVGFHLLWYGSGNTWRVNRWLGTLTEQNPNDVWITQEILFETKPDFVIETGTLHGGSATIWAMILSQINPAARVITIDIEDGVDEAHLAPIAREKVDFLVGSSTAPEIVAEVKKRVGGKSAMVILDSDHSAKHVLAELEAYAPLVPKGGYLIVQDTNVNGHPASPGFGPGPMEAVQEFLPRHPEFQADRSRERLLFTQHPNGYLRRVK